MEQLIQLLVSKVGIDRAQAEKVIGVLKENAAELPKWLSLGSVAASDVIKDLAQKMQAGPVGELVKGLAEKAQAGQMGDAVKGFAEKVQSGHVGDAVKDLAEKVTGGIGSLLNHPGPGPGSGPGTAPKSGS